MNTFNTFDTLFSDIAFPWYYNNPKTIKKDGNHQLTLAVPGFGKEDITIQVTELNYLEIKLKQYDTYRYKISNKIDLTKIAAECKNGILTITLPEKTEEQKKVISINIQ